jgi:hypothetical protein
MMEHIISRETMRKRGAKAFEQGLGINDHGMNPGSPAIEDWQAGWRDHRIMVCALHVVKSQLAEACPP